MAERRKERTVKKPYTKWSHEEKLKLIHTRIQYDKMFTSKNANMSDGWKRVAEVMNHPAKDFKACRQQWKNQLQKYKSYFEHRTGEGAGDDAELHKENWPFFYVIHEYASGKDNYHPPFLMDSTRGAYSMALSQANFDEHATTSSDSFITPAVSPPPIPSPSNFHPLTLYEQSMSPPPIPSTSLRSTNFDPLTILNQSMSPPPIPSTSLLSTNFDPLTVLNQSMSPPPIPSTLNFRPCTPIVPVLFPAPVPSTPRFRTLTPSPNVRSSSSPSTSSSAPTSSNPSRSLPASFKKMSEYEKYCVKRDKKLTRKIGGMISIFAQMVSREYIDIDVNNLLVTSSSEEDDI